MELLPVPIAREPTETSAQPLNSIDAGLGFRVFHLASRHCRSSCWARTPLVSAIPCMLELLVYTAGIESPQRSGATSAIFGDGGSPYRVLRGRRTAHRSASGCRLQTIPRQSRV